LKRALYNFLYRKARLKKILLCYVGASNPLPGGYNSPVHLLEAGENLKKGRLTRAVVTDKSQPLLLVDAERELREEWLFAEAFGDLLSADEGRVC
jgi:hypothetical protein